MGWFRNLGRLVSFQKGLLYHTVGLHVDSTGRALCPDPECVSFSTGESAFPKSVLSFVDSHGSLDQTFAPEPGCPALVVDVVTRIIGCVTTACPPPFLYGKKWDFTAEVVSLILPPVGAIGDLDDLVFDCCTCCTCEPPCPAGYVATDCQCSILSQGTCASPGTPPPLCRCNKQKLLMTISKTTPGGEPCLGCSGATCTFEMNWDGTVWTGAANCWGCDVTAKLTPCIGGGVVPSWTMDVTDSCACVMIVFDFGAPTDDGSGSGSLTCCPLYLSVFATLANQCCGCPDVLGACCSVRWTVTEIP